MADRLHTGAAELFAGPGEIRALARDLDWSATPLGAPATWSPALRTAALWIFDTAVPVCLWSGPEYALIYNDAYRRILAAKHPAAFGQSGSVVWAEIWEVLEAQFEQIRSGGAPLYFEDAPFVMARLEGGGTENAWFSYSLSALRDEDGAICAVLNISPETTARVLSAAALQRAEAEARVDAQRVQLALAAGAILGTWFWDIPADQFTADEPFANAFGLDPILCRVGIPLADIFATVHPDDRDGLADAINEAVARGGAYARQYRVRRADGQYHWVEANGRVEHAADGTPLSFPGVLLDISERKAADDALRRLNADLERQVIERSSERGTTWQISPFMLSVIDLSNGQFIRVNPAWTKALGFSAEELIGHYYGEFIHPDDVDISAAGYEQLESGQPVLDFENRYRTTAGDYRWLNWVAVPENGKLYSTTRDVTAEKAIVAERHEIWRVSQDMLLVIDNDGVIKAVNDAWTRTLGYTQDELVGSGFANFVDPADIEASWAALALASETALPRFENRYRHKDGSWRNLSWTAAPGRDFIYCVARDVTDEKLREHEFAELQESLRQSQKMEAVGQLTGGIAHDFNNLLVGITGSLELMQKRMGEQGIVGFDRHLGIAQASAQRAASLTQRLLAFSRRQTLDPRPVDVNRLITGVEDLFRRSVGPNIEIAVVGAVGLWPTKIDAPQLENALLNLVLNARDAMPDGGRITIESGNKWIDERAAKEHDLTPGQYIAICVTDTGTGMTPEVIERAFDPFYTTKPLGQGTGLGLSMIHGFVRQSGGQVRIYSEVGQGTTMCLYLPRFAGELDADVAPNEQAALEPGQGETVLVIDDEASIRMLITEVLGEVGYRVLEAGDGPAGLKVLNSDRRIDLLITDVGLPGGFNGRQVADAARQTRPDLKVLFVTGYADNAVIGNGHLDPGMQIITKPFPMAALAQRVREIIEG